MMKKIFIFVLLCSIAFAENPYRVFNNFNAGELSPLLNARDDLAKYQSGCQIMENLIPLPQGGAIKRPGTKYIAAVKTSSLATRLLPFEYSTSQSYIIEAGNQYFRFYTDGAQITQATGNETLAPGNKIAHWKLNDNTNTTAVVDAEVGQDGVASDNTDVLHRDSGVGTGGCFFFNGDDYVTVADDAALTFVTGGADDPFSIAAWIYLVHSSSTQAILTKQDASTANTEWAFYINSDNGLTMGIYDTSATNWSWNVSDSELTEGWHFVCGTYDGAGGDGAGGGSSAAGMTLYVDGAAVASTATEGATYTDMEDSATTVVIGAANLSGSSSYTNRFLDKIDNVALFGDVLTSGEISALYITATACEVTTPYLTADLFELKYEQSADVLYITHPDYEPRKLSRIGNANWTLEVTGFSNGPFRTQNSDVTKTIAADGTTGSVTLTAVGHAPFVADSTAGHIPNGSADTDKARTGALFKIVHPLGELEYHTQLEDSYDDNTAEDVSWMDCGTLFEGTEWTFITDDTWNGTVVVERNYTIGAAHDASGWEAVFEFSSSDDRNVSTTGTEDLGDADYRVRCTVNGDNGPIQIYFSTDQTAHIGIVKITAVTDSDTATATVLTTLASTDATHKWSEGSWSNYRGWPRTVSFFEDRLIFGGNASQPDTIWTSVTSDYEDMTEGADDDDALLFTLSSRQVNVIEWLIGKDKILVGTSGAEWSLEGGADEPLTPSNVIANQHSTYGSANLQANLANESVLFFQRGSEKMRELAYNWELDSYVAPDMMILSNLITNGGVTETAFQKTPDSVLWCIRDDGEMPVFSYERKENVTAWSRIVTEDGTSDSDFESVARISGDPEDEVWVIVERTINSSVVRYIEQFQDRDFGSDADDAYYVDCGVTYDSTASSAMTGLTHLVGETVSVLADGVVFDDAVVSATGTITLKSGGTTTTASTVQMGLPYEVHLQTMPLSWVGGVTIQGRQKRISEVIANWYNSGDFSIGKDTSNLETYSISGQTTNQDRKTFPPGYDREASVYIYQKSPEPLTLLGVATEFQVQQ
jgi:hypothetical protein